MVKNTILFFLSLCVSTSLFAQVEGCDGERYFYKIFDEVEKTTLQFGENYGASGDLEELWMDVYEPVGDLVEERPVVILAFGGGFITGVREDMEETCIEFAQKGYVAATIDYRLWPLLDLGIPDSLQALDQVIKAIGDMKAAIRYFRQDAALFNNFKINSNYIFIGGGSAGSITALHAAFLDETDDIPDYIQNSIDDNGGFEGNSGDADNLSYSSEVQAVINFSGALHKKEWIDSDDPPFISYHGTEDDVVPFEHGLVGASIQGLPIPIEIFSVDGSGVLSTYADAVGVDNLLVPAIGGAHDNIYGGAFQIYLDEFMEQGNIFLHNILCPGTMVDVKNDIEDYRSVSVYPNPAIEKMFVEVNNQGVQYDVYIYDQLGRRLAYFPGRMKPQISIDKNDLGTGMFFMQVIFADHPQDPILRKVTFN